MSNRLIGLLAIPLLAATLLMQPAQASAFQDRVDRSKGVAFGTFAATGSAEQLEKIFSRMDSVVLSAAVKSRVARVETPLLIVVYGSMSCPDCTTVLPIVEAMRRFNPRLEALYFERDIEARELLFERTGMNRIPTVFVAGPDDVLCDASFVEFPRVVRELVESAGSEEGKRSHIEAFRAGRYDAETQEELAELLLAALDPQPRD